MSTTITLTAAAAGVEYNYIIPSIAPYYLDGLTISVTATAKSWCSAPLATNTALVQGIDWEPSLRFASATAELGAPVYYAISFMDTALAGTVTISGNTADASYAPTGSQISTFAASGIDPLLTNWETFFNITTPYPSTTLTYRASNAQNVTALISSLNSLNSSLASASVKSVFNFNNHIGNTNNPHITTATGLGLGAVPNWTTASATDIVNKNASAFVTPGVVAAVGSAAVPQATISSWGGWLLSSGASVGGDTNATKALTASALVTLINSGTANAVNAYFNKPRQAVQFSPFPLTYPVTWKGNSYVRFIDLVNAVQSFTGINNLMYSDPLGTIWFPNSYTVPNGLLNHT